MKHTFAVTQPSTDTASQFPRRKKPKPITLRERRAKAKKIQAERQRTWDATAYGPNPEADDAGE